MKQIFTLALFILISISLTAQSSFTINGRLDSLISNSKKILVIGASGIFKGDIQSDGSFQIVGEVDEPGTYLIKTDSSGADLIWLEPGKYDLVAREIHYNGIKQPLFRTPKLEGPQDAMIIYTFHQPLYYLKKDESGSTLNNLKEFTTRYLDSILKTQATSKAIPELLDYSKTYLSEDVVRQYQSLLTEEQKEVGFNKSINTFFQRNEKIRSEGVFENFKMADLNGKQFELASVKGKKLILIDFWASDCAPCRSKHKTFVSYYSKYAAKGLEIISVSLDNSKHDWLKAISKDKMTWINVSELSGWKGSLAKNYFISSIPYSFWLDGEKKIISKELSEVEIRKYLEGNER